MRGRRRGGGRGNGKDEHARAGSAEKVCFEDERERGGREGVAICVGKRSMVNFFIFVNANNAE